MHMLLGRQLSSAEMTYREVDLRALLELVLTAYELSGNDRRPTDRWISFMIGELDRFSRGLNLKRVHDRPIGNGLLKVLGHALMADASIGAVVAPNDGTEPTKHFKNTDTALYQAKADGRCTYRFFAPEFEARGDLERELRTALVNSEFELYYQPLVDLQKDKVASCEALLRWHHPERGLIAPAEFISLAEQTGLIVPLGEWVLRKACADAALWPDEVKVAVNLSPIQVMSKNLTSGVIGALASSGLPPHRLEIEITESVLLQDTEMTSATLCQLRELGVRISMDDFGTGYSSLNYLRNFPFDKIKIDRCFINGLTHGRDSRAIVQAITSLATNLGIMTTAEGVETQQQLQQVKLLGCTEMQGFLFSPPHGVEQIARLLWPQVVNESVDGLRLQSRQCAPTGPHFSPNNVPENTKRDYKAFEALGG